MSTRNTWKDRRLIDPAYCQRSCCWSPYACAHGYECNCHLPEAVDK